MACTGHQHYANTARKLNSAEDQRLTWDTYSQYLSKAKSGKQWCDKLEFVQQKFKPAGMARTDMNAIGRCLFVSWLNTKEGDDKVSADGGKVNDFTNE